MSNAGVRTGKRARLSFASVAAAVILTACAGAGTNAPAVGPPPPAADLPSATAASAAAPSESLLPLPSTEVVRDEGPSINWDLPFGARATIPDIDTALTAAPGLSYRPFEPALGLTPTVVQRAGDWLVAVYRFPSGGAFRSDGRITVTQVKAEGADAYLHVGAGSTGSEADPDFVATTVEVGGRPARLLVNTRIDVGRVILDVDDVRVDVTGPDAPPAAVLDIAAKVLNSPRLGPAEAGGRCPPIPTSSFPLEGPVPLVALEVNLMSEWTLRREERLVVVPKGVTEELVASPDVTGVVRMESAGPQPSGYGTNFVAVAPGTTTISATDSSGVVYRMVVHVVC
ncbi:MAG: hypothetical protein ABIM89_06245 [Mycobacteriales bacterium]